MERSTQLRTTAGGDSVIAVEHDDGGYPVEVRRADGSRLDADLAADVTVAPRAEVDD